MSMNAFSKIYFKMLFGHNSGLNELNRGQRVQWFEMIITMWQVRWGPVIPREPEPDSSNWTPATLLKGIDSFTVPLHSPTSRPVVRAMQGDCQWGLKTGGNPHWSREPIMHLMWGIPWTIYRSANQSQQNSQWEILSHTPLTVLMPPG